MADKTYRIEAIVVLKDRFSKIANKIKSVTKGLKNSFLETSKTAFNYFKKAMLGVGGVLGTIGAIGIKTAGELEQIKIGLSAVAGGSKQATKELQMLKKFALKTPFEMKGLAQVYTTLRAAGIESKRSMKWIQEMGDTLSALGNTEAFDRMMFNLVQIKQKGRADLMDLRQMAGANIPIFQALSKALGVSTNKILEMTSKGKIGIREVEKAMKLLAGRGGKYFKAMEKQSKSLKGRWDALKEAFSITSAEIITQTGLFDLLKDAIGAIGDWVNANKDNIVNFIQNVSEKLGNVYNDYIKPLFDYIQAHKDTFLEVGKIALIVAGGFVAIGSAIAIVNAVLNPVYLMFVAFVALGYALKKAWGNNLWDMQGKLKALGDWWNKNGPTIRYYIAEFWKGFKVVAYYVGKVLGFIFRVVYWIIKTAVKLGLIKNAVKAILLPFKIMYWEVKSVYNVGLWLYNIFVKLARVVRGIHFPRIHLPFGRHAKGGIVTSEYQLVGERGPELVQLPKGSRVYTANETRKIAGGSNIVININAGNNANDIKEAVLGVIPEIQRRLNFYNRM